MKSEYCVICGIPLQKYAHKYCSYSCRKQAEIEKRNGTEAHGELKKICPECGKEFLTYKSRKITCSQECSIKRHNKRPRKKPTYEQNRKRWLKKHPDAKPIAEIRKATEERNRIKAEERERYVEEMNRRKAEREEQKRANIEFWQNYNAIHVCEVCENDFEAHYPTTKYCSDKCRNKANKQKNRYKTITVDRGINLYKLAKRDANICQLCGLQVNWDDYSVKDSTVVCGNMYPSIDHIKPISLGGLHSWNNVQLTHRICNTRKNNRFIG